MEIRTKRAYEAPDPDDGMRILVDRLWPRGIRKEALALDDWAKVLAPSTEARKAFAHKAENFDAFRTRYLAELDASEEAARYADELARRAPVRVTLLYGAKDPQLNQAVVLREWLGRQLADTPRGK